MNKIKKISVVTISAIVVAVVIAVSLLFFVPKTKSSEILVNKNNTDFQLIEKQGLMNLEFVDSPVSLSGGSGSTGVTKRVSATVSPVGSFSGLITWSVAWATDNSFGTGKNISDYIVIAVDEENTIFCDVTCLQVFSGDITIVATSSVGVSGSAVIRYVGVPTNISCSIPTYLSLSDNVYSLAPGVSRVNYSLSNGLGSIANTYKNINPEISFSSNGSVTIQCKRLLSEGSSWKNHGSTFNVDSSVLAEKIAPKINASFNVSGYANLTFKELSEYASDANPRSSCPEPFMDPDEYGYPAYDFVVVGFSSDFYFTCTLTYKINNVVVDSTSFNFIPVVSSTNMSVSGVDF